MRHVSFAFVLCVSACGGFPGAEGDCTDDPEARHLAQNPATGECWEFDSSCDVPPSWPECGDPPACSADAPCPPEYTCEEGMCVPVVVTGCLGDEDCPLHQHCDFMADGGGIAKSGVCVDNAACIVDADCLPGQWCDTGANDCDPSVPGCGGGICTRGERPPVGGTPCTTSLDCGPGELCPAEYGGPGVCEAACYDASICALDEYCNATEVCAPPPPEGGVPVPEPVCYGWCAQLAGRCDVSTDCASGEVCPSECTGEPVTACQKACWSTAECTMGQTCTVDMGCCLVAASKRDVPGAGGKQPAGAPEADSDALVPIACQGWCQ